MTKTTIAALLLALSTAACAEDPASTMASRTSTHGTASASSPTGGSSTASTTATTQPTDTTKPAATPNDDGADDDAAPAAAPVQVPAPAMACVTDTDAVTAAYKLALLRDPDAAGLAYYLREIKLGVSRFEVLQSLVGAKEFSDARAGLTDAQFVTGLYTGFLGRAPDDAGKAYYVGLLANGTSRVTVALGFLGSSEFEQTTPEHDCFF